MNEKNLIEYYNKFNEDKRFNSRRGKVEYIITMKYIKSYLSKKNNSKILDIGAGTGNYAIPLSNDGYDVTAIDLVKHNVRTIQNKNTNVKAQVGNATDLSKFKDESFDVVLLLGPMYHLISKEEKIKALSEAKRVTKRNGIIMVAYITNEYAIITHGCKENNIIDASNNGGVDNEFKITPNDDDLYSYIRIEDINELNNITDLKRLKIIGVDGPTNYMRKELNRMSDEEFKKFIEFNLSICERYELLGASAHILDILKK